jgi:hypothetical protein
MQSTLQQVLAVLIVPSTNTEQGIVSRILAELMTVAVYTIRENPYRLRLLGQNERG